jgi:diaminohydroxyphosphoribosylaminopyrimidine deaminase/5-amino-6-(5-phosphoribosylamino)uracil reductase
VTASTTDTDRAFLKRALELAEAGRGRVSPNPLVGAVVVRDGRVIGEGFHAELGGLHAERAALEDCRAGGEEPTGATLYVSLEPCAHHGRQPPCADAVLEAGIARVVIGSEDPSEKAGGRGPGILRDGGIEVSFAAGEEATAARLLNQPFRKHARTGLPLVVLKLAISLDGQTETAPGDSPWISGEPARSLVHRWRADSDAIAVGIGTAIADDPLLTARPPTDAARPIPKAGGPPTDAAGTTSAPAVRQPLRAVFDSHARLPLDSRLLRTVAKSPVIVLASEGAEPSRVAALREAGAEVVIAGGSTPTDRLHAALSDLGRRDITSLFLEGGRTLAAAFMAAEQIDETRTFISPILIGTPTAEGSDSSRAGGVETGRVDDDPARSAPLVPTTGPARVAAVHSAVEMVGDDVLIVSRFKEW